MAQGADGLPPLLQTPCIPLLQGVCSSLRQGGLHLFHINGRFDKRCTLHYNLKVRFTWRDDKNDLLKRSRNISFEQIVLAIESKKVVDVIEHPNQEKYQGQIFIMVEQNNYIYVVPAYISDSGEECHLETIYPSRKYTHKFLRSKE